MVLIDDLGNTVCVDEVTAQALLKRPGYKPFTEQADDSTQNNEGKKAKK